MAPKRHAEVRPESDKPMAVDSNENWSTCPRCGSPVLKNPASGETEACGNCAAQASRRGLYTGFLAILAGVVVFVLVLWLCINILFG